MEICFIRYSEQQFRDAPPGRKALRTKEQLRISTARMLEKQGYHGLKVPSIAEDAGVSEAAFYSHFRDKREAVVAVLGDAMAFLMALRASEPGGDSSPFEAIRRTNLFWLRAGFANAGITRCALQLADADPEWSHRWRRHARELVDRAVRGIIRRYPAGAIDPDIITVTIYGLNAIMDEYTRLAFSGDDPAFLRLREQCVPEDEDLADLLSVMWYRVLYPGLPIKEELRTAAQKLWKLDLSNSI